jgi:hypothetical protein
VEEGAHSPKGQKEKENVEDIVAQTEALPAQEPKTALIDAPTLVLPVKNLKNSKAPSKPRRKLQLDDELKVPKPKKNAPQSESLEDTFIFGLKPKKRQPKSKLKQTIAEEPVHEETEDVPAPTKRKRTAKAKQQVNDELCETAPGELNEEVLALEEKTQKRKRMHASRRLAEAMHVDTNTLGEEPPSTNTGVVSVKEDLLVSPQEETKQPETTAKATEPKATAKKAAKRTIEEPMDHETVTAPEPTAKRPRRQAAVSATAKVALGYEEELVPTDKLRRAPEPVTKRGRPKKTIAAEVTPVLLPSPPPSALKSPVEEGHGEAEVHIAKARPVGRPRKLGAKIATVDVGAIEKDAVATSPRTEVKMSAVEDSHHVVETDAPVQKAPPIKRARKVRARVVAQGHPANDEPSNETCEVEQKSKAPSSRTSRKAATKASKPVDIDEDVAAIEEVSDSPDCVIPETQGSYDVIIDPDSLAGVQTKKSSGGTKKKSRRALAESDVNIVRSLPRDDLGVIVKPITAKPHPSDGATIKPATRDNDNCKKQSNRNTKLVPVVNPAVEDEDDIHVTNSTPIPSVDIDHVKRARKAQPAQLSKSTPTIEPPHDEVLTPRKRHVIAADEDLDWLFEKSENKRSRVPARNPRASSKANRQAPVKKNADAKDMDLDDLLESIAGFSGKLLTGKSGRAMASK